MYDCRQSATTLARSEAADGVFHQIKGVSPCRGIIWYDAQVTGVRAGSVVNTRFGGHSPSGALCAPRTSTVEGFEPPRRVLVV